MSELGDEPGGGGPGDARRGGRGRRGLHAPRGRGRPRWPLVLGAVALVVLLVAGAGVVWVRRQADPPGAGGRQVTVEVPMGASTQRIAELLDQKGVVRDGRLFHLYVRAKNAGPFQSGSYTLPRNGSFDEVIAALEKGPTLSFDRVTIPEGLTLRQIADRVGKLPGRSAERFLEVAGGGEIRSKYQPPGTNNLEGLILPDTYNVEDKDDERAILQRMVAAFDDVADRNGLAGVVEGGLVNPYQAVIVASMVEREARVDEDRGMISRVVYNRLKQRMPLQVDATVIYAQGRTGEKDLRLLNKDLEVDSPYNTYRVRGLPPTPIAAPGRAALRAAIDPPPGPWLYYVVVEPNGKHAFATTLEEHNRNIALAQSRGLR